VRDSFRRGLFHHCQHKSIKRYLPGLFHFAGGVSFGGGDGMENPKGSVWTDPLPGLILFFFV